MDRCCCSLLKRLASTSVLSSCKEVLLFSFKTVRGYMTQLSYREVLFFSFKTARREMT